MSAMRIERKIQDDIPIGYLVHEHTHSKIAVFKPINFWQRWWIKICFGLKYEGL